MTAVPAPGIPGTRVRAAVRAVAYSGPPAALVALPGPRHALELSGVVALAVAVCLLAGWVRDRVRNVLALRWMRRRALTSAHAAGCKVFVDTPELTFFCGGCADRPVPVA